MPKSTDTINVMERNPQTVKTVMIVHADAVAHDEVSNLPNSVVDAHTNFESENYMMTGTNLYALTRDLHVSYRAKIEQSENVA